MCATPRVILVGSGFASLETAFLLRRTLEDRVDLAVVSDIDSFVFKPGVVRLPFGEAGQRWLRVPVRAGLRGRRIAFHHGRVAAVEPGRQVVHLADGRFLRYDYLVIGTGARPHPEEVPGLEEHASTGWSPEAMRRLGTRLEALRSRAARGERLDLLFVVPPANTCSSPLYELAFRTESWLRRHHVRDRFSLTCSTAEPAYLPELGPSAHRVVSAEFARREISGHPGEVVEKVLDGEAVFAGGATRVLRRDHRVSVLRRRGRLRTAADRRPWVPRHGAADPTGDRTAQRLRPRRRRGSPGPAGHSGAGASRGGRQPPRPRAGRPAFRPPVRPGTSPIGVLGGAPISRSPLRLPAPAPAARAGVGDPLGVSPIWRLGRQVLGAYVPVCFGVGEPFQLAPGSTLLRAAARAVRAFPRS